MAPLVGCAVQTVRHVIQALNTYGVAGLRQPSNRPQTVAPGRDATGWTRLQPRLQQSPRLDGKPTGVWTLALAAAVGDEQGVTARLRSDATLRRPRQHLQTNGQRAQHGLTSPDPYEARKHSGALG
jgi:hypothetical protein